MTPLYALSESGDALTAVDEPLPVIELRDPHFVAALVHGDPNPATRRDTELELVEHAVRAGKGLAVDRTGSLSWAGEPVQQPAVFEFTPPPRPNGTPADLRQELEGLHAAALARGRDLEEAVRRVEAEFDGKQLARALEALQRDDAQRRRDLWAATVATQQALEAAVREPVRITGQTVAVVEYLRWLQGNVPAAEFIHRVRQLLDGGEAVDDVGLFVEKNLALPPAHLKKHVADMEALLAHPALRGGSPRRREMAEVRWARTMRERVLAALKR